MSSTWKRRFSFFDHVHLGTHPLDITCSTSGRGVIALGDASGYVHLVSDADFERHPFQAFRRSVNHLVMLKKSSVLVGIGDGHDWRPSEEQDESRIAASVARSAAAAKAGRGAGAGAGAGAGGGGAEDSDPAPGEDLPPLPAMATVKVWRLDRREDGSPPRAVQVRQFRVLNLKGAETPDNLVVTTLAVTEDLSQIAVGFTDGSVTILRGEFLRDRGGVQRDVLRPAGPSPVTFLGFAERKIAAAASSGTSTSLASTMASTIATTLRGRKSAVSSSLYVVTRTDARSYFTAGPTPPGVPQDGRVTLSVGAGCEPRCAVVSEDDKQSLVIGNDDGIFFFSPTDRGVCYGFPGEKALVSWFRSYLLVASVDTATQRRVTLAVYDLENRFVAFSFSVNASPARRRPLGGRGAAGSTRIGGGAGAGAGAGTGAGGDLDSGRPQHLRHVVSEFGAIFVVTSALEVRKLTEKDTSTKLARLFAINYYDIAIALAKSSNYDVANVIDIYRMYGDYEYERKDFNRAIEQYIHTIGHVEPSYVIRRFLDAQRIHNLTSYLEALHGRQYATADHTTLLLNCYTKLKEDEKLRRFIRGDEAASTELNFEVDTAIVVLRGAGYQDDALYLADKHKMHDWYLKIQVEDRLDFAAALAYIDTLEFLEKEKNLKRYGRYLVSNSPKTTTTMLTALCAVGSASADGGLLRGDPAEYIPLYVDQPRYLKKFLQSVVTALSADADADEDLANPLVWNTLLELCLREEISLDELEAEGAIERDDSEGGSGSGSGGGGGSGAGVGAGAGAGASDDAKNPSSSTGKKASSTSSTTVRGAMIAAAVERKRDDEILHGILQNPVANYDVDHALVLVQMHGYRSGQLYLFEQLAMYPMVVQHYLELAAAHQAAGRHSDARAARRTVVSKCKAFGDKDPDLWVQVLADFSQKYSGTSEEADSIRDVLDHIDSEGLLPPLLVVQIVSQNPKAPVGLVSDFIVRRLSRESETITEDQRMIRQFRTETDANRAQIHSLKTKAQIFRSRKCDHCSTDLDLPAVHFLCMHSYHQHCIPDNEEEHECPICAPHHRRVRDIHDSLGDKVGQHEQFFQELKVASDGFGTVAEYFGKGAFSNGPSEPVLIELGDDDDDDDEE